MGGWSVKKQFHVGSSCGAARKNFATDKSQNAKQDLFGTIILNINVVDVEFNPNPNLISSSIKSGDHVSHSSGNGYKATPIN